MIGTVLLLCTLVLLSPLTRYTALHRRERTAVLVGAALIPFLALGIYLNAGSYSQVQLSERIPETGPPSPALIKDITALLKAHPDNPGYALWLAQQHITDKQYPLALPYLNDLTQQYPQDTDLLLQRLHIHAAVHGATDEHTKKYLKALLSLAPRHPQILESAAVLALQSGDKDAAVQHWQTLLQVLPEGERRERLKQLLIQMRPR